MNDAEFLKIPEELVAAIEVMNGIYGVGEERKNLLEKAGFDARRVQEIVNFLVEIWR